MYFSMAALLIAPVAMLYGLFLLILKKGRRKRGLLVIVLAPVIGVVVITADFVVSTNREAREAGFASATDKSTAEQAGITDPEEWAEQKAAVAAEEAAKARLAAEREAERERAEEQARLAAEEAEIAREAAKKAEDRRKGFHCLSAWDGSHRGFVDIVKNNLRDPKSFEHMETRVTPVSDEGTHTILMTYRARNGFGGMNVETAVGVYDQEDCTAVFLGSQ